MQFLAIKVQHTIMNCSATPNHESLLSQKQLQCLIHEFCKFSSQLSGFERFPPVSG
jgi:hypothetical protein